MKVSILATYIKKEDKSLKFEFDQTSKRRPAWIKLINSKTKPGFLRIRINDTAEVVYRAFGDYFYPVDITPNEQKKFMAGISKDYDLTVQKNNVPWAQLLAEKLEKLGLRKNAQIIDFGAGTGIVSEAMIDRGYHNLTLIDYSPEMLAIAKRKPKLIKAKFVIANVKKLNLKDKYDAVISVMLLNEIEPEKELEKVLIKAKKIIKSGGLIALVEESKKPIYSKLFEKIEDGSTKPTPSLNITRYFFIGRKL